MTGHEQPTRQPASCFLTGRGLDGREGGRGREGEETYQKIPLIKEGGGGEEGGACIIRGGLSLACRERFEWRAKAYTREAHTCGVASIIPKKNNPAKKTIPIPPS